uniref:Uncharacterized protein n=1 Tax=Nelumbo nucifera TaxID=4432 RepID=A0A822ZBC2_NELNU|nr:TPA_asm: hypothetical protein HUJ06_016176 [Nelumbo nucifera]
MEMGPASTIPPSACICCHRIRGMEFSTTIPLLLLRGKPMNPMRKPALDNSTVMIDEINLLKEKLTEKEKQLDMVREENELLKKKMKEAAVKSASFLVMEEESAL